MTPSNLAILVSMSVLVFLLPATSVAEEFATPADLAQLALRSQQVRERADEQLRASVAAVTESEGRAISLRMTERLKRRNLRSAMQRDSAPPAKRAFADATPSLQRASNTVCTRVGATLACVLRDPAVR